MNDQPETANVAGWSTRLVNIESKATEYPAVKVFIPALSKNKTDADCSSHFGFY